MVGAGDHRPWRFSKSTLSRAVDGLRKRFGSVGLDLQDYLDADGKGHYELKQIHVDVVELLLAEQGHGDVDRALFGRSGGASPLGLTDENKRFFSRAAISKVQAALAVAAGGSESGNANALASESSSPDATGEAPGTDAEDLGAGAATAGRGGSRRPVPRVPRGAWIGVGALLAATVAVIVILAAHGGSTKQQTGPPRYEFSGTGAGAARRIQTLRPPADRTGRPCRCTTAS